LMIHVVSNACRDGARYAVINMSKPSNFDTYAYQDSAGNIYPSIAEYTRTRLSGVDKMVISTTPTTYYSVTGTGTTANCKIQVFLCDMTQMQASPPVATPDTTKTSWNGPTFSFGDRLAVAVSGTYTPVLPNFLLMGATIPVNMIVTMGAE